MSHESIQALTEKYSEAEKHFAKALEILKTASPSIFFNPIIICGQGKQYNLMADQDLSVMFEEMQCDYLISEIQKTEIICQSLKAVVEKEKVRRRRKESIQNILGIANKKQEAQAEAVRVAQEIVKLPTPSTSTTIPVSQPNINPFSIPVPVPLRLATPANPNN